MKRNLQDQIGRTITVTVPLHGGVSLSIRGELQCYGNVEDDGFYHIVGNPAIRFDAEDIYSLEFGGRDDLGLILVNIRLKH